MRAPRDSLTVEEKVQALSGLDFWHLKGVGGRRSVMVTDGPHGLRKQAEGSDHVGLAHSIPATCFPTASALASTWDLGLVEEVGAALGRECRAEGVAVLLGPGLNLKRHPGGGRNFEYFSEDPFLSGKLAAAHVRGVQSADVGTSLKHFVANNHEAHRMTVDVIVDERTLRELYLTGFEIAVKEAAPWTVMCSYNKLNGEYVADSRRLLTEILRDEWGFEGLVVTDWGATNDKPKGIGAGLDLEMPSSNGAHDRAVLDALEDGSLPMAALEVAVDRVIALIDRSTTDKGQPVDMDAHIDLARRASAAGTVLLTNAGVLPLAPGVSVAVIGAFAAQPRYQGAGSSLVNPTRLDTALDAFKEALGPERCSYSEGYDPKTGETTPAWLEAAVRNASAADVAVVFVGLPSSYESEGFDRAHLEIPPGHTQLIEAVTTANPRTVVVLSNGAPVLMPWVDKAAAVVEGYLGGQAGGAAIVDVLTGAAEPGGRLAESLPADTDLPADQRFHGQGRQCEYRETLYVGYRFHDRGTPARFPFGHGLSYSTFEVGDVTVTGSGYEWTVTASVRNTGERFGSDVVQVYVRDVETSVYRPEKELKGFAKVHLAPGESVTVEVPLGFRAFAFWDVETSAWQIEGGAFEIIVGRSSTSVDATVEIAVEGTVSPTPIRDPGFMASDDAFAMLLGRPIPTPVPTRPFTRTTTIGELGETSLGSVLRALLRRASNAQIKRLVGDDPETIETFGPMFEAVVMEAPLRSMVGLSGGKLSFAGLDRLIRLLNRFSRG